MNEVKNAKSDSPRTVQIVGHNYTGAKDRVAFQHNTRVTIAWMINLCDIEKIHRRIISIQNVFS